MELFQIIEEVVDDDLLFILKYGLIISNFITIFILLYFKSKKQHNQKEEKKCVLIVTAHPDDEAMFFLPTISYLNDKNYEVHLLCLSNGNANNIGKIREAELQKCCKYNSNINLFYCIVKTKNLVNLVRYNNVTNNRKEAIIINITSYFRQLQNYLLFIYIILRFHYISFTIIFPIHFELQFTTIIKCSFENSFTIQ